MLTLLDIIEGIVGIELESGQVPPIEFADVVTDSQQAREESLFVALKGEREDGHDYIHDAIRRGAKGVILERMPEECGWLIELEGEELPLRLPAAISAPVCLKVTDSLLALQRMAASWRRKHPCEVIGVTGSLGKTTAKEVIWTVLSQRFSTLKSQANYNTEIGLPLTLLGLTQDHEKAILEMAMYDVGEIRLLAELSGPRIGVITNVGPIHLERLGSLERIAQAKGELVEALPSTGFAILNGDDPLVRPMARRTQAEVLYFGLTPQCHLWADNVESQGLRGLSFGLNFEGERIEVKTPLLGRESVQAALAAAAVGLAEGLSWGEIVAGLEGVSTQPRLIVLTGREGPTIIDDTYNASPASTIAALDFLAELNGRKIAILGDMLELGSYEEEGHYLVGRRAAQGVAKLIVVGQRGRLIGQEALRYGMKGEDVFFAADNPGAMEYMVKILESGDCILVKGSRGTRMEEIVAGLVGQ